MSIPIVSHAYSIKTSNSKVKYQRLILPVGRVPELVGAKIEAIKDLSVCYNGEIYKGNSWILPDKIIKTKLYGSIAELPIIERDKLSANDILILEIPVINSKLPDKKCPWGLDHALARLHNRLKLDITTKDETGREREYSLYIYYDEKSVYDKHLSITPISMIKKLSEKLKIDYHDITSLKNKLIQISIKNTMIKNAIIESMNKFVFTKDYSKLLNDPVTGYSTEEALEICPSCPIMDGDGSSMYSSELYFYLTRKEIGGPITPPSSNAHNISKVYLGRGGNIEKISLYIVGSSMSESNNSTLYVSITLQENRDNRLLDEDTWVNASTIVRYLTFSPDPTYRILEFAKDQLDLKPYKYYRAIIEFQWVYDSQPYIHSAVLSVERTYTSTTLDDLPGNPSITAKTTQIRVIGEYYKPSTPNPMSITILLKPLSGAIDDTYTLYSSVNIRPDWQRSFTASITFNLKIYVNGIHRKTISFTLDYSEDKNLIVNIPIYCSDFFYKGAIWITYQLERTPSNVYGDFTTRAYLSSDIFVDVWDAENPYAYVKNGPPADQYIKYVSITTQGYNRTIISVSGIGPHLKAWFSQDSDIPVIHYYQYLYDNAGILSWQLKISSNRDISIALEKHFQQGTRAASYVEYIINGLLIGLGVFLTYITSGFSLLIQILVQLVSSTVFDIVSYFASKLVGEGVLDVIPINSNTWYVVYDAPLIDEKTEMSFVVDIKIPLSSDERSSAPIGIIVTIDIHSDEVEYFSSNKHIVSYIYVYNYDSDIPGIAEPSNWINQDKYGIWYG